MNHLIRILSIGFAFCMILTLAGCPFSTEPGDDDPVKSPYQPRISPENLLLNLVVAYDKRSLQEYTNLFDSEEFIFLFSDADVAAGDVPEELSYDDEIAIHDVMFNDNLIDKLELEYEIGPCTIDEELTTEADTVMTITVTSVVLELKGRLPGFPDMTPQTWRLDNGEERFWFHKRGPDGEPGIDEDTGEPLWSIIQWQEF